MPRPQAVPALLSRRRAELAALGIYGTLSFLFLGLPLLETSGPRYAGQGADPELFIWAIAWWPHAILHGHNPFVSHAIWAPGGANVMWTSSVPAIAALVFPITLLAGPVAAFNTAVVLMPAVAAWTAFLLCRHLTRSFAASLLGGYLFGFSSYELTHDAGGHLHLTSVFLLPLAALLVLRYLDGGLDRRGLVARLGPLLTVQILLSTELAMTLTIALALSLALGFLLARPRRSRIASLLPPLAASYGIGVILTSPFLYYALRGFHSGLPYPQDAFYSDLLSFVVPASRSTFLFGSLYRDAAQVNGDEAYLGLPTLLIVVLFARSFGRTAGGRFVLAAFLAAVILALGPFLTVDGRRVGILPWAIVHHLPGFNDVLTARFGVYVALAAGVAAAMWLASARPGPLRVALPALAVLAIVPTFTTAVWATPYRLPAFVTAPAYSGCLDSKANLLTLPVLQGDSELWQVERHFGFRLAGGWLGEWYIPPAFLATPGLTVATPGLRLGARQAQTIRSFVKAHHVTAIVVEERYAKVFAGALDRLAPPRQVGGVVLYELTPGASCLG